jgi:hypothetical protein
LLLGKNRKRPRAKVAQDSKMSDEMRDLVIMTALLLVSLRVDKRLPERVHGLSRRIETESRPGSEKKCEEINAPDVAITRIEGGQSIECTTNLRA